MIRTATLTATVLILLLPACVSTALGDDKSVAQKNSTTPTPREKGQIGFAYVIEPPDIVVVQVLKALPDHPLSAEKFVRSDGTIDLEYYGSVRIAGNTVEAARQVVEDHLAAYIRKPQVRLDVLAYNSKHYYVMTDGAGFEERAFRLSCTGNEKVVDAITQIGGIPQTAAKKRIWLVRPDPRGGKGAHLPVDWDAITVRGDLSTNYQIIPNDRIYIQGPLHSAEGGVFSRLLNRIESVFCLNFFESATITEVKDAHESNDQAAETQKSTAVKTAPLPPLDPNNALDALLLKWEAKSQGVQTLHAKVVREKKDVIFRESQVFEGEAKFMRPNLALLELHDRDKPDKIEKYICTGTHLYDFRQESKEVRVHKWLPPKDRGWALGKDLGWPFSFFRLFTTGPLFASWDENFLAFLFAIRAQEAKARFQIEHLPEDKFYQYLRFLPRDREGKSSMKEVRVAISKEACMPRQIALVEPNGNMVTWDIQIIHDAKPLDQREFTAPILPDGWTLIEPPKNTDEQKPPGKGKSPVSLSPLSK